MDKHITTAQIETHDGTVTTIAMPAFRQVLRNPDGSTGQPVPIDDDALVVQTGNGRITLHIQDIQSIEQVDEGLRFRTATGQYIGKLTTVDLSSVVIVGILADQQVNIPFDTVTKFARIACSVTPNGAMNSSNTEALLIAFIDAAKHAQHVLSQYRGFEVLESDIQSALAEVLEVHEDNAVELIFKGLTAQAIIELLRGFDFVKYHPELLAEIHLKESILPEGTQKLLTEQTVRMKGEVWQIYKNDADPFPSAPHAHNYASGLSLHLGTGELFRKRAKSGQIGCKELVAIRNRLSSFELPELDERCR